jgi:hypothetical protein
MLEQVNPEQDRPDSADGNLDVRDVSGSEDEKGENDNMTYPKLGLGDP